MDVRDLLYGIQDNIDDVIARKGPEGEKLWHRLLHTHPVNIADIFKNLIQDNVKKLYQALPHSMQLDVFHELSDKLKVYVLSFLDDDEQVEAFQTLSTDELTDLFDVFSDEELKRYLGSLNKRVHEKVRKILKFDPESAAG